MPSKIKYCTKKLVEPTELADDVWYDKILTLKQIRASQTAATRLEEEESKSKSKSKKVKVMETILPQRKLRMKSEVRTKEVKSKLRAKVKVIVNMKELTKNREKVKVMIVGLDWIGLLGMV